MDESRDYYEILQVHPRAGQEVIKRAYRTLSRTYHPDANPPEKRAWAENMMSRLNEAYRVLSDPEARREYDARRDSDAPATSRTGRRRDEATVSAAVRSCHWHPGRPRVSICTVCGRSVCAECRRTDGMAVVCPDCQGASRPAAVETETTTAGKAESNERTGRSGIAAAFNQLRSTDGLNQAAFAVMHIAVGALALGLWLRGFILLVAFRFPGNLHLVWPLAIAASILGMVAIGVVTTAMRAFRWPALTVSGGLLLALVAVFLFYDLRAQPHARLAESASRQGRLHDAISHYSFALWQRAGNHTNLRHRLGHAYLAAFGDNAGAKGSVLAAGALIYLAEHSSPKALKQWIRDDDSEPLPVVALSRDEILTLYRGAEIAAGRDARLMWTLTACVLTRVPTESAGAQFQGIHAACLGLSFYALSHAVRGMPQEALRRADDQYIGFIDRILDKKTEKARGPLEEFYREKAEEFLTDEVQRTAATEGLGAQVNQVRERLGDDKDQQPSPGAPFIGNRQSHVYHRPDCEYLPAPENQVGIWSVRHARAQGYRPCEHCHPQDSEAASEGEAPPDG